MTRDELLEKLRALGDTRTDAEQVHCAADAALLAYIEDAEIDTSYNAIKKWYA